MKTILAHCATFALGAACAVCYFYFVHNPEAARKAFNNGAIAASLGALQESVHRDVINLKKGD